MQTTKRARSRRTSVRPAKLKAEWLRELDSLFGDIASWCESRKWWVHRDHKTIDCDAFGPYDAPVLMIQSPQGRFMVDPVGHDIVGAEGRVEIQAWPTFDRMVLIRNNGRWRIHPDLDFDRPRRWSRDGFFDAVRELKF